MERAVYRFSPDKAFQAVHYMASQKRPLDLHAALKACYFADKSHLNQHQQPIFGATYRAMKYGPVPIEIYEIIKGENLWLWELKKSEFPWRLASFNIILESNAPVELSGFAESEIEHLQAGLEKSCSMSFTDRTAATHGPDWQKANGGTMRYEDMIDEGPNKEAIVQFMQETAHRVRL